MLDAMLTYTGGGRASARQQSRVLDGRRAGQTDAHPHSEGSGTLAHMTVLIDQPAWPAHGTLWSHLVSDETIQELHDFAASAGVPRRAFDLDHYDVPAERYAELVSLGARPVSMRELVERLRGSGLRVRAVDRR